MEPLSYLLPTVATAGRNSSYDCFTDHVKTMHMKLHCLIALLICSCTKAGSSADTVPPGPPSLAGWYLNRAQAAAYECGATATSSRDTLIVDYDDYTHPINDSALYRQQYASPIARYVALKTYFEFWPSGQLKESAFNYDYSLNPIMIFHVYHATGVTRFWFVSRYAANIYSF